MKDIIEMTVSELWREVAESNKRIAKIKKTLKLSKLNAIIDIDYEK